MKNIQKYKNGVIYNVININGNSQPRPRRRQKQQTNYKQNSYNPYPFIRSNVALPSYATYENPNINRFNSVQDEYIRDKIKQLEQRNNNPMIEDIQGQLQNIQEEQANQRNYTNSAGMYLMRLEDRINDRFQQIKPPYAFDDNSGSFASTVDDNSFIPQSNQNISSMRNIDDSSVDDIEDNSSFTPSKSSPVIRRIRFKPISRAKTFQKPLVLNELQENKEPSNEETFFQPPFEETPIKEEEIFFRPLFEPENKQEEIRQEELPPAKVEEYNQSPFPPVEEEEDDESQFPQLPSDLSFRPEEKVKESSEQEEIFKKPKIVSFSLESPKEFKDFFKTYSLSEYNRLGNDEFYRKHNLLNTKDPNFEQMKKEYEDKLGYEINITQNEEKEEYKPEMKAEDIQIRPPMNNETFEEENISPDKRKEPEIIDKPNIIENQDEEPEEDEDEKPKTTNKKVGRGGAQPGAGRKKATVENEEYKKLQNKYKELNGGKGHPSTSISVIRDAIKKIEKERQVKIKLLKKEYTELGGINNTILSSTDENLIMNATLSLAKKQYKELGGNTKVILNSTSITPVKKAINDIEQQKQKEIDDNLKFHIIQYKSRGGSDPEIIKSKNVDNIRQAIYNIPEPMTTRSRSKKK